MSRLRKRGTSLTLMLCGRSGLGKSTFLNTLCGSELNSEPSATLELSKRDISLTDYHGRPLHLCVIDTPGFGQSIDASGHVKQIVQYVEQQFDEVLSQETRVDRNTHLVDSRVHCCLYFLPGRVGQLDYEAIAALSTVVNVIPVLSKSDTLTGEERARIKSKVQAALAKLPIYNFNFDLGEEDHEYVEECLALRGLIPFAVSGSNSFHTANGELSRGRLHPWGFARCEDPEVSDVGILRSVLFGDQLDEIKQATLGMYEAYRTRILTKRSAASTTSVTASSTMGSTTTFYDSASKTSV